MPNELEPTKECPFCGSMSSRLWEHEEGCYLRMYADTKEDWYTAGYHRNSDDFDFVAANEHRFDRHSNEDLIQAWNTRYKRTCRILFENECPVCLECQQDIDPSWVACPYCGAEVIGE